jgi:cytochrome P450
MSDQAKKPLVDFDTLDPNFIHAPFDKYTHLRNECPVAYTEMDGGVWLLSRYEDVRNALLDYETFSSSGPHGIFLPHFPKHAPFIPPEVDPPVHTKYRNLLLKLFSRAKVSEYEILLRERVHEIIDMFIDRRSCCLREDYSHKVATKTLSLFMRVSEEEVETWKVWVDALFTSSAGDDQELQERWESTLQKMDDYIDSLRKKLDNDEVDNLFTDLMKLEIDDRPLTVTEIKSLIKTIQVAGHDPIVYPLSSALWLLAQLPEHRQQLVRQPELIYSAVEELLRLLSNSSMFLRTTTKSVASRGHTIPKGANVVLLLNSANRDEDKFTNPDQCILERTPNSHIAFGAGPHACLGAHLARLAMRVGISEFLQRIPDFQPSASEEPVLFPDGATYGYERVVVKW